MWYQFWALNLICKLSFFVLFTFCLALSAKAEIENIDSYQLRDLIAEGVVVVDVRTEPEWRDTGIISKSYLITFFDSDGRYDVKDWIGKLKKIATKNEPVIIICRSGRRSLIVAEYLSENESYNKVYNAVAGIKGWNRAKLNLEDF
jgi:rhodanese-related sulfurtransferase